MSPWSPSAITGIGLIRRPIANDETRKRASVEARFVADDSDCRVESRVDSQLTAKTTTAAEMVRVRLAVEFAEVPSKANGKRRVVRRSRGRKRHIDRLRL